ncbi:DUF2059 domain-containing protein [Roseibium litorale]|uniref:DUF2059 domain-containing protein n=1 Tax=Roseibium litorale TaxID=2803841 RepID=A0ABR9CPN7_9HYPH|nr:DUF2059 domain-containing protein [Roseibium litorale]MBD8892820.1 DUF2059 domain-containing protein [Roseibium litorale]
MKIKSVFSASAAFGAVMFALAAAPVYAQDGEFTESHLAAAKEVVTATKALSSFDDILPLLAEQTRTLFVQSDPARTQEIVDVTSEVALKLAAKRAELNKTIYEIWARRFTEDELKQLVEFYNSPLGSKLTDNGPTITALAIGAARQWQDQISSELVAMVREELDKRAAAAAAEAPKQ